MSETFIELLVKRKNKMGDTILKCCLLGLTIGFALIGFFMNPLLLFAAIIFAGLYYLVKMRSNVEYEYSYLDKELTIDKIFNQSKRKRAMTLDLERLEVLAPVNSHQLDSYRNREGKVIDFSSGYVNEPDTRYLMLVDGGKKIMIEPNTEILTAIRSIAPRKVFLD